MATTPDAVRADLAVVTSAAVAETQQVAQSTSDPVEMRAALFAAVPLIVGDYADGAAALALDWYDELREEARPQHVFTPRPLVLVTDDDVAAIVASTTRALHDIQQGFEREIEEAAAESVRLLEAEVERTVADGFRDTITGNAKQDPEAAGWRRFARPEACKFCKMLAAKGAVFTRETARFAAHGAVVDGKRRGGDCMCIAGPAFGGQEIWAEATPMQYVASQKTRTPEQRAALRDYLNTNYPDAPG